MTKIQVEPLSDERWEAIERGVFRELDGADAPRQVNLAPRQVNLAPRTAMRAPWKRAVAWVSVAAAAAVVGGLSVRALHPATTATNTASDVPTQIVTGSSPSHLALNGADGDVGADSSVLVSGNDAQGYFVVLDRGDISFSVVPRGGRPPFIVQAGEVRVRVVGTQFRVTRLERSARVTVSHGTVEVSAPTGVSLVHTGESWESGVLGAPPIPSMPSMIVMPATPSSVTEWIPEEPKGTTNSSEHRAIHPRRSDDKHHALVTNGAAASTATTATGVPPISGSVVRSNDTGPQNGSAREVVVTPDAQHRFEQASRSEASKPSESLAIYREIVAGGGPWAANALFAAGRLEADRGNKGEAKRLLTEYIRRFPSGPNARDARELLTHTE